MKFWDASAILPLCLQESHSMAMKEIIEDDRQIVIWWGTPIECSSAFARLRREKILSEIEEERSRDILKMLLQACHEIQPTDNIRKKAERILRLHPLRSADSLQLAAALVWAQDQPDDHDFVCLDKRLIHAAHLEGFHILPHST